MPSEATPGRSLSAASLPDLRRQPAAKVATPSREPPGCPSAVTSQQGAATAALARLPRARARPKVTRARAFPAHGRHGAPARGARAAAWRGFAAAAGQAEGPAAPARASRAGWRRIRPPGGPDRASPRCPALPCPAPSSSSPRSALARASARLRLGVTRRGGSCCSHSDGAGAPETRAEAPESAQAAGRQRAPPATLTPPPAGAPPGASASPPPPAPAPAPRRCPRGAWSWPEPIKAPEKHPSAATTGQEQAERSTRDSGGGAAARAPRRPQHHLPHHGRSMGLRQGQR